MQVYPSWRYHKELEPKLIHSADEEMKDWVDSPALLQVEVKEEIKPEVKEVLSESLDEEIGKVKVKKGKK